MNRNEIKAELIEVLSNEIKTIQEQLISLHENLSGANYVVRSAAGIYLQRDKTGALIPSCITRASRFTLEEAEKIVAGIPGDFWGENNTIFALHIARGLLHEQNKTKKQIKELEAL